MESADDDAARRELAVKDLRKGGQANLDRLARMIALRQQEAGLLGYSSYADYVQEVYMAGKAVTVDGDLPTGVAGATNAEYVPYHICSSKTVVHKIHHDRAHPSHLLLPIIPFLIN